MSAETDRYVRINRNNLVADTNLSEKGSVTSAITNPSSETLWSRVGGRTTTYAAPLPGYCLRFNSSNQVAYIQTAIPSSERDKYRIVIKGEGTIDHLYVDTSATNIAIKQMDSITDSSYFDLSYVAFINKTTGDIEHLFECEETTGTLLYDAVRGATASLSNVTSESAMRVYTNKQKEWIADYSNLDDKVQCIGGANAGLLITKDISSNNLTPLRDEYLRSCCFTLELKKDFDTTLVNPYIQLIGDAVLGGSNRNYGHGLMLTKGVAGGANGFAYYFETGSASLVYYRNLKQIFGEANVSDAVIKAGTYKICVITNIADDAANSYLKTNVNGIEYSITLNTSGKEITTSNIKWGTDSDKIDTFRLLSVRGGNYQPKYNLPCQISNVKVFGFDVSADGAAYTVEDYTNGRQIDNPSTFTGLLLDYGNLSYIQSLYYANTYVWLDRGPKKAHLQCASNAVGNFEFPCKNYGTWLNNVGWTKPSGSNVYIPRAIAGGGTVFELNSSMQFEHSWTNNAGAGTVGYEFEDDGTLVCKVTEEVTLANAFSFPDLKLVGGIYPNLISDKLVRITCDSQYINPDIYLIGNSSSTANYGKGLKVLGLKTINSDWYEHPNDFMTTVSGVDGYKYIGTNNFHIGMNPVRSKDNTLLTIPVGTILWKVKGLKLELIS